MKSSTLPPASPLPSLVQTAWLLRDPVGFFTHLRRRHGDVIRVRFPGFRKYVYVGDPKLAREVYASSGLVGQARRDFLEPVVGQHSLLCVEGDAWLRQRQLVGPAFHRRHIEGLDEDIAQIAREQLARWPLGEPFALRPRMQAITLEVILRLVFGVTDAARLDGLRRVLPELMELGASPLLWVLPRPVRARLDTSRALRRRPSPLRRFLQRRDEADALIYAEIAARRAGAATDGRDVLTRLLDSRDEAGEPMSDAELRDELITLLEAGHETTATALSWAVERLVRTPHALERLLAEIDAGVEETYLDAVVRETLRARPVVYETPRLLDAPLRLGSYEIPAGWYVAPALPLVQSVHADADAFRPERFLESRDAQTAWIPFGGGKRHCVGSHLALLELRVILREVLGALSFAAVDAPPERAKIQHVTLVPSALTLVRATARQAGRAAPAPLGHGG